MSINVFAQHPALLCPFPSALHAEGAHVEQQTMKWAWQYGLIENDHDARRLERSRFSMLMARAYPTTSRATLQLIADWNTWTFLLDDQFDEHLTGRDPDAVEKMHARILCILAGEAPRRDDSSRIVALHSIAQRLRVQRNEEWMERFQACVRDTLAASLWEARNRQARLVPVEQDYRYWRLFTSGVYCYFTLIELAAQIVLPTFVLEHPVIAQLARSANYAICWSNDLFSLGKELARSDVHNLAYVVHRERQMSLDDACAYVAAEHDKEVVRFQQCRHALPAFGPQLDRAVACYADGLATWMRANMDWSMLTYRYRIETRQ